MQSNLRSLWCLFIAALLVLSVGATGCGEDDGDNSDAMSSSSGDGMSSSSGDGMSSSGGDMEEDTTMMVEELSCQGIFECINGLANPQDQAAFTACVNAGSSDAQSQFAAIAMCAQTNCANAMTDAEAQQCISDNCGTQSAACEGDTIGPGDCDSITEATEVGQACGQSMPCPAGASCITMQGDSTGTCRQDCAPNTCVQFCGTGDACLGVSGAPAGGVCIPPTTCDEIAQATEVGQVCNPSTPCPDGAACITTSAQGDGVCRQQCVPGDCEEFCAMGDTCTAFTGGAACIPPTTCDDIVQASQTGQACGQTSGPCPDGATCIVTMQGATEGACFQNCVPAECEEFCGTNSTCMSVPGTGGAVCAPSAAP